MFLTDSKCLDIVDELTRLGIDLHKDKAKFELLNDRIMSYYYELADKSLIEISVICDDDMLRDMSFYDLINLKRIGYFQFSLSRPIDNKIIKVISYKTRGFKLN